MAEIARLCAEHGQPALNSNPVVNVVTEGREDKYNALKPRSSSCGDLLHCVAEAGGYRGPALNRGKDWQVGVNLSRWFFSRNHRVRRKVKAHDLLPGDFLCFRAYALTAHACVFLEYDGARGDVITADYGQPGGKIVKRDIAKVNSLLDLVVSLDDLIWAERSLTLAEFCELHGLD